MRLFQWMLLGICTLALGAPPAGADADLKLPRERVALVAPPFVHPHEQATKLGPKIIEFTMTVVEKAVVIDEAGTKKFSLLPIMALFQGRSWSCMKATMSN